MGYTVLLSNTVNSDNTTNMEHMNDENKQDVGVMISHNDFYVVVCRKYEGDKTITYPDFITFLRHHIAQIENQ